MPEAVFRRILHELATTATKYWQDHPDASREVVVRKVADDSGFARDYVRNAIIVHDVEPSQAFSSNEELSV
jgi:uncharacterized protein YihD (DUF1040 family)